MSVRVCKCVCRSLETRLYPVGVGCNTAFLSVLSNLSVCPSVKPAPVSLCFCVFLPASRPNAPGRVIHSSISGEDVGYPATLAFRRTSRLVRLMATCCPLSVSLFLCASHCRCTAICSSNHSSENPSSSN